MPQDDWEALRRAYADRVTQLAHTGDSRIARAFAAVPRERFLPPPPWSVISAGVTAQTEDLSAIYDNVLVAIDPQRGINNGEPALHAAWLAAVHPQPGDRVVHVGAGAGYYTAILGLLVQPGGRVEAYEYEPDLAEAAARNLQGEAAVTVHAGSAFGRPLPPVDVIYVNAAVAAPDTEWLKALKPGGRLIFPWRPGRSWGPTVLVTRREQGYEARPLMNVGFIPCSGTGEEPSGRALGEAEMAAIRSLWLTESRRPDASALAVYRDVWFSSDSVEE